MGFRERDREEDSDSGWAHRRVEQKKQEQETDWLHQLSQKRRGFNWSQGESRKVRVRPV